MASKIKDDISATKLGEALQSIIEIRKQAKEYIETSKTVCTDRIDYFNHLLQSACFELYNVLEIQADYNGQETKDRNN
jgi:hypothetical protein